MSLDARRLEELSLNSSEPPEQWLYDGWILRLLPGKAKRARSVNPVRPSSRPLAQKIAHCERLYGEAGLPAIFRITPFVEPPGLDGELERRGYGRFDTTAVESAPLDPRQLSTDAATELALGDWADAVGELRGSPPEHRAAHLARIDRMPLEKVAVGIFVEGRIVATGLSILEDGAAGLFDIVTHEGHRRSGHARRIVAGLLARARARGARDAYLQVDQANGAARALYRQFGFTERYLYWYRGRPGEQC